MSFNHLTYLLYTLNWYHYSINCRALWIFNYFNFESILFYYNHTLLLCAWQLIWSHQFILSLPLTRITLKLAWKESVLFTPFWRNPLKCTHTIWLCLWIYCTEDNVLDSVYLVVQTSVQWPLTIINHNIANMKVCIPIHILFTILNLQLGITQ